MAQVSGRVTLRGEPLPEGMVMFVPQAGLAAGGGIQPDGTYRLFTRKPFDGAVIGKYKVCVMKPFQPKAAGYPGFATKYSDAETSGFEVDVQPGENRFDFDLDE
jgi:hypothetical protein